MSRNVLDQIVRAIAEAEDVDPTELEEPLERFVPTDAIRDLVAHSNNSWRLQFETRVHVVEVRGNNTILVDGEQKRRFC
jgi:hypothetical protein